MRSWAVGGAGSLVKRARGGCREGGEEEAALAAAQAPCGHTHDAERSRRTGRRARRMAQRQQRRRRLRRKPKLRAFCGAAVGWHGERHARRPACSRLRSLLAPRACLYFALLALRAIRAAVRCAHAASGRSQRVRAPAALLRTPPLRRVAGLARDCECSSPPAGPARIQRGRRSWWGDAGRGARGGGEHADGAERGLPPECKQYERTGATLHQPRPVWQWRRRARGIRSRFWQHARND